MANLAKPRKVIILDVNDEYKGYKLVRPAKDDIEKFLLQKVIQARRVSPYKEDGTTRDLNDWVNDLKIILRYFRGGLVVVEDVSSYIGHNYGTEIIGKLCTQRHVDCDIIINYQGIGKAGHPQMVMNMNIMRFHKCNDSVERHKDKFDDKEQILKIAEKVVHNKYFRGNKYYYVIIDMDEHKISGDFTKTEFKTAIFEYIVENEKFTISPLLRRKDREGKLLYDYPKALAVLEEKLMGYYGNDRRKKPGDRDNLLYIAVGRKKTGKTFIAKKIIENYVRGNVGP
jgi:hypothetical protein